MYEYSQTLHVLRISFANSHGQYHILSAMYVIPVPL